MQALTTYTRMLLVVLLLVIKAEAFATDERFAAQPLDGSKGQVKKDSSTTAKDTAFLGDQSIPTPVVKNVITFSINEYSLKKLPDQFDVNVQLKVYVTRYDYDHSTFVMDSSLTTYLHVTYNKNDHYYRRAAYTFAGGFQVKVKILNITSDVGTLSDYDSVLMLENEIMVTRAYGFSCTNNAVQSITGDTSDVSAAGELKVSWPKERVADEYDLEWTYIDTAALAGYKTGGNPDPRKIFDNNATRVSISKENYAIPLLYDDAGVLYFRVRTVQVSSSGQRKEAHWSSDYTGGLGSYSFNGHERTLNWQATTSYAEEGKRKSVLQYYDGSLRSRQTVTKDNTTDTTLVAETLYDYQGRPVIQVLPAPSFSRMIQYTPNFSVDVNNAEYDKTKYDGPAASFNYCGPGAAPMGTQSGASKYYSPANQNVNISFHQYIPDAKLYPFTETQYTQDNTGRISKQGGVGPVFQIGKVDSATGMTHETKYYYGSADQEDIDGLFGSEAGNANHYFKNMVRDANGQYSVSYVDMHGRTVATALAGHPLAAIKMDSLESGRVMWVTKKLVDSTNNIVKGLSIEASKSLVVTRAGAHTFHYSLRPDSLLLKGCDSNSVCYTCRYNLQITISDDCNNQTLPGGLPIVVADSNFTIGHVGTTADTVGFDKQFTDTLEEGTYTITKRLTISNYAMNYYHDSVFIQHNTCRTLTDYIADQQRLLLGQITCAPSCARCSIDTFSNWTLYRPWYMNQLGIAAADTAGFRYQAWTAYNDQREACDEVCGTTLMSTYIRNQMLADMTPPYGQYANPDSVDNFSIFSTASGRYYNTVLYTNEKGIPDTIYLVNGDTVAAAKLSIPDFISNFKPSWAENLLSLHPEYCKLDLYQSEPAFTSSHAWDNRFENTNTYKQALDSGYLNPLGYTDAPVSASSTIHDPFFNSSINPAYASAWRSILNDSMRQKATRTGG
ncbi:MAG TPA: hypothetical protein VLD19_13135, partial [Chitinophagaceae bacterium]|nr:hypothetical protein [Chitinophagaceae bacterium]